MVAPQTTKMMGVEAQRMMIIAWRNVGYRCQTQWWMPFAQAQALGGWKLSFLLFRKTVIRQNKAMACVNKKIILKIANGMAATATIAY
jgi:hypothetical protein